MHSRQTIPRRDSYRSRFAPFASGLLAFLGCALLLAAGCGGEGGSTPSSPAGTAGADAEAGSPETVKSGLEILSPTVQWVPGMTMAAVYLDVVDHDGEGDRLARAESSLAKAVETHESLADGDTVRMEARPDGFEVPPGGILKLEPGGKHIMLVEPVAPAEGAGFDLTLVFEKAGPIPVTVEVIGGAMDHSGMDHSEMDHSGMDHSEMDHSGMDHSESGGDDEEGGSGGAH